MVYNYLLREYCQYECKILGFKPLHIIPVSFLKYNVSINCERMCLQRSFVLILQSDKKCLFNGDLTSERQVDTHPTEAGTTEIFQDWVSAV